MLEGIKRLAPGDAYLVRRVFLEGVEVDARARNWRIDEKMFAGDLEGGGEETDAAGKRRNTGGNGTAIEANSECA